MSQAQHYVHDPLNIVRDFSDTLMRDFTGVMRNRRRVLHKVISEKFRPKDSRREIMLNIVRGRGKPNQPPQMVVRFMEHDDRFQTTSNTRQTRKSVRIDVDDCAIDKLNELYKREIKSWLTTTEETVRAPEVPMPVRMNSVEPVDILMPAAFEIASVVMLVQKGVPLYRMQNADKSCFYDIPVSEWIFAKPYEDFAGSFVVTHLNGDRQIISANVFHDQFMAV